MYDYITGEQSYQTVTATSIRQTNELVALSVGSEQIVTTPRHPFYVVNDDTYHGYTAAEYLSTGDCVLTADGDYAVIESVEKQLLAEPIDVYNFTVENNHSYYVGDRQLLVHNAGECENVSNLKVNQRNLQHEFKHAKDFGISGDWNNENKAKFMKAIVDHLDDPNTVSKMSTFRGQPVTVYYNKITGNGVYLRSGTGEFWCGWKLTPDQIKFHGF